MPRSMRALAALRFSIVTAQPPSQTSPLRATRQSIATPRNSGHIRVDVNDSTGDTVTVEGLDFNNPNTTLESINDQPTNGALPWTTKARRHKVGDPPLEHGGWFTIVNQPWVPQIDPCLQDA